MVGTTSMTFSTEHVDDCHFTSKFQLRHMKGIETHFSFTTETHGGSLKYCVHESFLDYGRYGALFRCSCEIDNAIDTE